MDIDQIRHDIASKASEVMKLLTDLNEAEKTISRLRNEIIESRVELKKMYEEIDEALDK